MAGSIPASVTMAKKDDEPTTVEPAGWQDDYELAFPSEYLGAVHLRGYEVPLTISRVRMPELKLVKPGMAPKKQRRMVVEFDELKKRTDGIPFKWILNKTNSATIGGMHGKAPRNWAGCRVTLWPDPNVDDPKKPGKKCTAIRVRPRAPGPDDKARKVGQQRDQGAGPPPDGADAPAAGPPSEEEMQEIARREAEEAD